MSYIISNSRFFFSVLGDSRLLWIIYKNIFSLILIIAALIRKFISGSENISHYRFHESESNLYSKGGSASPFSHGVSWCKSKLLLIVLRKSRKRIRIFLLFPLPFVSPTSVLSLRYALLRRLKNESLFLFESFKKENYYQPFSRSTGGVYYPFIAPTPLAQFRFVRSFSQIESKRSITFFFSVRNDDNRLRWCY